MSRFVQNAVPSQKAISPHVLALMPKLRMLIVASNTEPPLDAVDRETDELYTYLRQKQGYFPVDTTLIRSEQATYSRIKQELATKSYDIIHYAGHGSYHASSPEESCLYFWEEENKQGDTVQMTANELKLCLEDSSTRLVYLSCCSAAATANKNTLLGNNFLGLADAVVQAGVPSVLGFRWPVSDDGAKAFALAFYASLLEQGSPEIAAWRARRTLAGPDPGDPTWLSPILIHQQ
jgi:CHAT domain-containing protein